MVGVSLSLGEIIFKTTFNCSEKILSHNILDSVLLSLFALSIDKIIMHSINKSMKQILMQVSRGSKLIIYKTLLVCWPRKSQLFLLLFFITFDKTNPQDHSPEIIKSISFSDGNPAYEVSAMLIFKDFWQCTRM